MAGIADDRDVVEATGKNVDDAVENALAELELERHEVTIEVISAGRAGLFGIGGEQARVRVTRGAAPAAAAPSIRGVAADAPPGDDVGYATETLQKLVQLMDLGAQVSARPPETAGDGVGLTKAVLDIRGDDLGMLIGRRGGTMMSLQYLLNLMVSRKFKNDAPFAVDVDGYRQRREESLHSLALRMAERVRASGREVTLEPMPANERRIVHLALAEDESVSTSSVGEGEARKVVISARQ